jgi:hypothetical protein
MEQEKEHSHTKECERKVFPDASYHIKERHIFTRRAEKKYVLYSSVVYE